MWVSVVVDLDSNKATVLIVVVCFLNQYVIYVIDFVTKLSKHDGEKLDTVPSS